MTSAMGGDAQIVKRERATRGGEGGWRDGAYWPPLEERIDSEQPTGPDKAPEAWGRGAGSTAKSRRARKAASVRPGRVSWSGLVENSAASEKTDERMPAGQKSDANARACRRGRRPVHR